MRRASVPIDLLAREVDTPSDASGSKAGMRAIVAWLALAGLGALGATGLAIFSERHTVVRGVVVAHRTVPALSYGARRETTRDGRELLPPDRRVLLIRTDAGAVRETDVPPRFWNQARDGDRVRRENGIWRVIDRHTQDRNRRS